MDSKKGFCIVYAADDEKTTSEAKVVSSILEGALERAKAGASSQLQPSK